MTEFVEISVNFKALGFSIDGVDDKKSGAKIRYPVRGENQKGERQ